MCTSTAKPAVARVGPVDAPVYHRGSTGRSSAAGHGTPPLRVMGPALETVPSRWRFRKVTGTRPGCRCAHRSGVRLSRHPGPTLKDPQKREPLSSQNLGRIVPPGLELLTQARGASYPRVWNYSGQGPDASRKACATTQNASLRRRRDSNVSQRPEHFPATVQRQRRCVPGESLATNPTDVPRSARSGGVAPRRPQRTCTPGALRGSQIDLFTRQIHGLASPAEPSTHCGRGCGGAPWPGLVRSTPRYIYHRGSTGRSSAAGHGTHPLRRPIRDAASFSSAQ